MNLAKKTNLPEKLSLFQKIEQKYKQKKLIPSFNVGDVIKIRYRIFEGQKERIQTFEGLVIAIQNRGLGRSITIRRTIDGIGVEQMFFLHSSKIEGVEKKPGIIARRSKLYYLRDKLGKIF
ncbi:MAG: 50S ribosomal protein L19 [Pedobacter sp.]|nr:MAG: 50S ribosomal protein L19 [Pedobacter sp.]